MYKIGDVVMYRRNVCVVKEIITNFREQGGYYKLSPLYDKTLVIHAPADSPKGIFRPLLNKGEIEALINEIPNIECVEVDDRLLENTYKELFNSARHEDLVKIIKTAYSRGEHKAQKGLKRTENDKMYFQKAEKALYSELAIVLDKTIDETREYIIERMTVYTV